MLQFYNTRTKKLEEFKPLKGNQVRMYGCGPTVYNYAHIGNLRAYIFYNLLRRYLLYKGYDVLFAMNLTDVDDKTIRSSREKGKSLRDYLYISVLHPCAISEALYGGDNLPFRKEPPCSQLLQISSDRHSIRS